MCTDFCMNLSTQEHKYWVIGKFILVVKQTTRLFSRIALWFCIPTSIIWPDSVFFLHSNEFGNYPFFCSLVHSDRCEWYLSFNLHSLIDKDVKCFFIRLLAIHMLSLVKCPFMSFAHFLIGYFLLFWGFFICSRYKFFVQNVLCKYLLCSLFFYCL